MCATLSSDGWFGFVGVPQNAEITFRRADGVNARLHTGRLTASPRILELTRKEVEVRGNRRI